MKSKYDQSMLKSIHIGILNDIKKAERLIQKYQKLGTVSKNYLDAFERHSKLVYQELKIRTTIQEKERQLRAQSHGITPVIFSPADNAKERPKSELTIALNKLGTHFSPTILVRKVKSHSVPCFTHEEEPVEVVQKPTHVQTMHDFFSKRTVIIQKTIVSSDEEEEEEEESDDRNEDELMFEMEMPL